VAFNGSGTYNLYTPGNPVVTGTTISSTWANNTLTDIATGLSNVICKDGQSTTTGTIPFATAVTMASTLSVTGAVTLSGNATVGGTLGVTGATTLSSTLAVTGVATFTAKPILSTLTTSQAVFSDGSKGLVSNAITGTGNVVMSASPTLSGTVGGALTWSGAQTYSSAMTYGGVTLSNAVTGTGNMVLSASPTFTGTLTAAAITMSGDIQQNNATYLRGKTAAAVSTRLIGVTGGDALFFGSIDAVLSGGLVYVNNGVTQFTVSSVGTFAISNALTVGTTLGVTGAITASNLTASRGVLTDSSKNLISADAPVTNSLGADVTLSNTALYFDGPSAANGTSGTWFASGTVTLFASAASNIFLKLWDGTTLIASTNVYIPAASANVSASLSGYITGPVGNLRISARDGTRTDSKIIFNATGNSKDSTISAIRVA